MEHGLYTIRDRTGELCAPLFQSHNVGVARRQFLGLLRKVPDYDRDAFQLWYVGTFDDVTGRITPLDRPEIIEADLPKWEEGPEQRNFGFEEGRG